MEQIPGFLTHKDQFKSDNYISMQIQTINNEGFQTTTAKSTLSNDNTTYALDNSKPFNLFTSTKRLYRRGSKHINKNKDNNEHFGYVTLTKRLCSCKNKHISKNSKNSDSKSQIATASFATSTKHLAKCKIAYVEVHNNSSEKTETFTPTITIQQLRNDFLILVILTRSIRSHGSKHISTKSDTNSLAKNLSHISTT